MTRRMCAQGLVVLLSAICFTSIASAQTSWWRTFGGTDREEGNSVHQTADGGYIVAGWTESFGVGSQAVYLIKTSAHGDTAWTRMYGGTDFYRGLSGQGTTDGGCVIAGYVYRQGDQYVYLLKTNASGDTLWTRTYELIGYECGESVRQTTDGGYVIAGYTAQGNDDVYVVKTNSHGDLLWDMTYGGSDSEGGASVQQTTDGGYIIAGDTKSFGAGNHDVYLIKTNASGDTLWTRTYGGPADDGGASVQQTSDGGYIIVGSTGSFGAGGGDVYAIKTRASGDTLWTRTYGGSKNDGGGSVQQTSDGSYIIVGTTNSFGAGKADVYLIKTNAQGDTFWTRTFGGPDDDGGSSVQQTTDGGYIIGGHTTSFGAGEIDVYLIKTDVNGNVGVAEESLKPRVSGHRLAATILSGASGVKRLVSCVVFDAMGRRVHDPKPGVYFVRDEGQGTRDVGRTRKVVIQR